MRMSFDRGYFVQKDGNGDYVNVKYGDTRKESSNDTNYRSDAEKIPLHGNSGGAGVGKQLERSVLRRLADKGMAMRIGQSETYVVKKPTAEALQKNWDANAGDHNYLSRERLDNIANVKVYNKPGRRVHGNAKGDKF